MKKVLLKKEIHMLIIIINKKYEVIPDKQLYFSTKHKLKVTLIFVLNICHFRRLLNKQHNAE